MTHEMPIVRSRGRIEEYDRPQDQPTGGNMRHILLGAVLVMAAFAASPAAAAKYKCNCYKDAKAGLEAKEDVNINCVDTYTKFNESSSVQEKQLKVYVAGDHKVQGDNDTQIRFRPRDNKCFAAAYDGNAQALRWA